MVYRILADLTVIAHFGFIAFVVFGGILVRWWPGIAWLHVPVLAWALGIEQTGWPCPLTVLEKWLRIQGGWGGYLGDFVHHWIIAPLFDPGVVTPTTRSLLTLVPVAVNAYAYWRVFRDRQRPNARPRTASASCPCTHA